MNEQVNKYNGEAEDYQSFDMELLWECTKCGYTVHRKDGLPETCPSCNASKTEFTLHKED